MLSKASDLDRSFGMTQGTENGHVASSCEHSKELPWEFINQERNY